MPDTNTPELPPRPTEAIDACASAFIDCTLHAQKAIALAAYVKALERALADRERAAMGGDAE